MLKYIKVPESSYTELTELQNLRLSEDGRELWVHLAQSLLKKGHPEQSAQGHI